ncbi:MAG: hypothetical protein EXR52_02435 [Dehalococcoidia bacterium]|nr:hypothetical protein [Dehalococcoidia bacterium]
MTGIRIVPQSREYLRLGAAMVLSRPWLFLQIVTVFSMPALLATWLLINVPFGPVWREPVVFVLNTLTIVVAPVVFMIAVSTCNHGDEVSLPSLLWRSLPWVPRYVWTNCHTSIIFWLPMTLALTLKDAISHGTAMSAVAAGLTPFDIGVWLLVLGPLALYLHSRTLLAPFLAVHGDRPGTLATWQSWEGSTRRFPLLLSTFVLGCIPTAVPVALVAYAVANGLAGRLPADSDALTPLLGVGLQIVRLSLVPAAYQMYLDLESIMEDEAPATDVVPRPLQPLAAFSTWCNAHVPEHPLLQRIGGLNRPR